MRPAKKRKVAPGKEQTMVLRSDLHSPANRGVITPGLGATEDTFALWHGQHNRFTIHFHERQECFELPEAALAASFEYFKTMFSSQIDFSERAARSVEFQQDMLPEHFEVLVTWLQTGLLKMPRDPGSAISMCIATISDADYLQMVNLDGYSAAVGEFLRKTLRRNREAITKEHLAAIRLRSDLFQGKAMPVSTVLAEAAVRPFLTSDMERYHIDDHQHVTREWSQTVSHYKVLMDGDIHYTKSVMAEVRHTLCASDRKMHLAHRVWRHEIEQWVEVENKDPDFDGIKIDVVEYPDPLFKHAETMWDSSFNI